MGLKLGVFGFLPTTLAKTHTKQMLPRSSRTVQCFICVYFTSRSDRGRCRLMMQVTYAPAESQLFWLWENPEDPQFEPHAGIKMVQVLGSPVYIYGYTTDMNGKYQMLAPFSCQLVALIRVFFVFPVINITVIHQVGMSPASAVWAWE